MINNEEGEAKSSLPHHPWVIGQLETPVGKVAQVATTLSLTDRIVSWKARWAIRRLNYRIEPGLYALGIPDNNSPVLVSANYKMSFDRLRSRMNGRNAWLLILDTKGINVWCAAGKGTFGTDELIHRIKTANVFDVVSHRTIILPQLGAPGVAAHQVKKKTGFRVIYGPVQAADLPNFLDSGLKATTDMRRINFPFPDRIVLTPVELVMALKPAGITLFILIILGGIGKDIFSAGRMVSHAGYALALISSGLLLGAVVTPALLPWIPGKPLAVKGAIAGVVGAFLLNQLLEVSHSSAMGVGGFLLLITFSSFLSMNFTGATTYTSLSGVRKEMKFAVPAQILTLTIGLGFLIAGYWI